VGGKKKKLKLLQNLPFLIFFNGLIARDYYFKLKGKGKKVVNFVFRWKQTQTGVLMPKR